MNETLATSIMIDWFKKQRFKALVSVHWFPVSGLLSGAYVMYRSFVEQYEHLDNGLFINYEMGASMHGEENKCWIPLEGMRKCLDFSFEGRGGQTIFTLFTYQLAGHSISFKKLLLCSTFSLMYKHFCFLLSPSLGITLFNNSLQVKVYKIKRYSHESACMWICVCMNSCTNWGGSSIFEPLLGGGGKYIWPDNYIYTFRRATCLPPP